MTKTLRGRPRLDIPLVDILLEIRREGRVLRAARQLGCSDAYVHVKLKEVGLTLRDVLEANDVEALFLKVSGGPPA